MSHKVPEDGGVDAESYAKEPLRSATSSISRERASGFYVRYILANMRVQKRAQRLAMLHRFPIISKLIDLVSTVRDNEISVGVPRNTPRTCGG